MATPKLVLGGTSLALFPLLLVDHGNKMKFGPPRDVYALEIINYTPIGTVKNKEFVWKGVKMASRSDSQTGLHYLPFHSYQGEINRNNNRFSTSKANTTISANDEESVLSASLHGNDSPVDELILHGTPLGVGTKGQLLLHDSGITIEEVTKYVEIMIGGNPLSVGLARDKWYLLMNNEKRVNNIISFRRGESPTTSYDGCEDNYMWEKFKNSNFHFNNIMSIKKAPGLNEGLLIKWDISSITDVNPVVTDASIDFTVSSTTSTDTFNIYEILQDVVINNESTWNRYNDLNLWGSEGATSVGVDRGATSLGTVAGATGVITLNSNFKDLVQAWIDGTKTNRGITIQDYGSGTGQLTYYSSEINPNNNRRPKLTITYET
jgi:hypothetical protein